MYINLSIIWSVINSQGWKPKPYSNKVPAHIVKRWIIDEKYLEKLLILAKNIYKMIELK